MIAKLFLNGAFLWTCAWQSTIILAVGLFFSSLIGKHRPAHSHHLLLMSMITALVVPIASIMIKCLGLGLLPVADTSLHMSNTLTLFGLFRPILFVAILVLVLRLTFRIITDIMMFRNATPACHKDIMSVTRAAAFALPGSHQPDLYVSKNVRSPAIWSWGKKPILIIPLSQEVCPGWMGVVWHELAHWIRRDHCWRLISEIICCFLPWQPLAWIARNKLISLSECACDDWVIAFGEDPADYADGLLQLAHPEKSLLAMPIYGSTTGLAKRIRRILTVKPKAGFFGDSWLFGADTLILLLAITLAFLQSTQSARFVPDFAVALAQGVHQPGTNYEPVSLNIQLSQENPTNHNVVPEPSTLLLFGLGGLLLRSKYRPKRRGRTRLGIVTGDEKR